MNQQMDGNSEYLVKILIIGNSGVGKSCLLTRFTENQFTNNFYNTIGVDFKTKLMKIDNKSVKLQIWDTAGQDRFRTITSSYYKGAHGIIIAYDITDRESFEKVQQWMSEIDQLANQNANRILVGNKYDSQDKRVISTNDGRMLADSYNIPFFETSAKQNINIENAFQTIARECLNRLGNQLRVQSTGVKLISNNNRRNTQQKKKKDELDIENCCT